MNDRGNHNDTDRIATPHTEIDNQTYLSSPHTAICRFLAHLLGHAPKSTQRKIQYLKLINTF